ncbi:unnamed protein product [Adineta steineri]|uniref:EGF-like domain-containing protein n=1 Tax=Adineta steineri TaxID=433720 RepID=A0A813NX51_9BILA|nr:unnamed protein product [Adineta steineri]
MIHKIFHMKYLFYLVFLQLTITLSQINLQNTGWVSENEKNDILQHDCLRFDMLNEVGNFSREIIHFCMSELPSKFRIEENNFFPKFTFDQLAKQNITSEQLYFWSALIDIIEDYQFYLNQLPILNDLVLSKNVFYNCTLPRFGLTCQYEFFHYHSIYLSLYEMLKKFYKSHEYKPTNLTCYTHLQCTRGHSSACLDCTEICNGQIDCLNGGVDEEYCWQLEINECNENEHRCNNGQCIHKSFFQDGNVDTEARDVYDCLDGSDENKNTNSLATTCRTEMPSFRCEHIICTFSLAITSSCVNKRDDLIWKSMYSVKDNSTSDQCWSAFVCNGIDLHKPNPSNCTDSCAKYDCYEVFERECPDIFYIPIIPVLFGDIYFAYEKCKSCVENPNLFKYPYACYNNSRYDNYFNEASDKKYNYSKLLFNNRACHRLPDSFILQQAESFSVTRLYLVRELRSKLWRYHEIYNYNSTICNRSNMYQCSNSLKCISKHRLMDDVIDCPNSDDENKTWLNYTDSTEEIIDVGGETDKEIIMKIWYARKNISFQTVCDGFTELSPITTDGRNETDETECEHWPCNNIYTHCNGLWNCLNGADEIDCHLYSPSLLNCSSNEHLCISPDANQFICLPISKANDGKVDCIGATDEPKFCRTEYKVTNYHNFYCMNQSSEPCLTFSELCNNNNECTYGDDEQFCTTEKEFSFYSICWATSPRNASDVENFLCNQMDEYTKQPVIYFTLDGMKKSVSDLTKHIENKERSSVIIGETEKPNLPQLRCHRGIDIRIWLNDKNNKTESTCLCQPSYYGDQCQYQNQQISLSLRFQTSSDSWQIPFAIVILLIDDDNEQMIHSYEQLTYLSMRDCENKSHLYLTYSNRPKNETKNYGIHIDIYEKISSKYRASLFFPIQFLFLPVHRLSLLINIPNRDINMESCSNNLCINGRCIKYSNNKEKTFCQCNTGWFGRYCTIKHS